MTNEQCDVDQQRRRLLKAVLLGTSVAALDACGGGGGSGSAGGIVSVAPTRTWRMGFYPTPPRLDTTVLLQGIDRMSTRAELIHIHQELPWTDLLAGMSPSALIDRDFKEFAAYVRGKSLRLGYMADLTDGLSRSEEAPQLRALGRSIQEPAVQQVYRNFVLAVAEKLKPDYIGLTSETNLVRAAAPAGVYAAMVTAVNAAAADLISAKATVPLMISVQVEVAWGLLGGAGAFVGIDQDFRDFPFMTLLGLSSYPYFDFDQAAKIPTDYYTRLLLGRSIAAMVAEGGWTSANVGNVKSSPEEQARYITRHAQLLDSIGASAVVQTLYADLDLASLPPPVPPILAQFADLGLTDANFVAKPAQAVWDELFARRRL